MGDGPFEPVVFAEDVTPPELRRLNEATSVVEGFWERRNERRVRARSLFPCVPSWPCWLQRRCCEEYVSYARPTIRPKAFPTEINEVTIRPFKGRVDGRVSTAIKNESTEGTETRRSVCQCRGGNEGTTTRRVPGSATLRGFADHFHVYEEFNTTMDKLRHAFDNVQPQVSLVATAGFQKAGIKAILSSFVDLFKQWAFHHPAVMTVTANIDSEIHYSWLGRDNTQQWHFDVPHVSLPVRKFNVDWSLV